MLASAVGALVLIGILGISLLGFLGLRASRHRTGRANDPGSSAILSPRPDIHPEEPI